MISFKLKKELKTMDKSNPLFRRMVLKLMRHEMNKNKLNIEREKVLLTPPPPSSSSSSSTIITNQQFQFNQNSNFDLDFQNMLDFEQTTFHHSNFDIHDLSNL